MSNYFKEHNLGPYAVAQRLSLITNICLVISCTSILSGLIMILCGNQDYINLCTITIISMFYVLRRITTADYADRVYTVGEHTIRASIIIPSFEVVVAHM